MPRQYRRVLRPGRAVSPRHPLPPHRITQSRPQRRVALAPVRQPHRRQNPARRRTTHSARAAASARPHAPASTRSPAHDPLRYPAPHPARSPIHRAHHRLISARAGNPGPFSIHRSRPPRILERPRAASTRRRKRQPHASPYHPTRYPRAVPSSAPAPAPCLLQRPPPRRACFSARPRAVPASAPAFRLIPSSSPSLLMPSA